MNILFVSEYFPPKIMGGGEINLFLLAKNLAKKGINVYVLTSNFKGLKKYEDIKGIKVYRRLKTGKNVDNIIDNFLRSSAFPKSLTEEIKKLNKKIDFDVTHFICSSIIASSVCKKLNKKCVATVESYLTLCPKGDLIYKGKHICRYKCGFLTFLGCLLNSSEVGKIKNRFYLRYNPLFWSYLYRYHKKLKNSLKNCNLIAISDYVKGRLRKEGLKSTVIPNMIEIEKFYSKKHKGKKIKIIYLGSLTKYKGPHILLKAVKGLKCRVDLYGAGALKNELLRLIRENNIDAKIHKNVSYGKILDIYATSDIIVFPSIWPEPFGRIAVEAMASGKPVIASDIGGIKETVKGCGILVKAEDANELRKAIIKLMKNRKLRESLGKKGKTSVKEYSKDIVIKKLISFYSKIE